MMSSITLWRHDTVIPDFPAQPRRCCITAPGGDSPIVFTGQCSLPWPAAIGAYFLVCAPLNRRQYSLRDIQHFCTIAAEKRAKTAAPVAFDIRGDGKGLATRKIRTDASDMLGCLKQPLTGSTTKKPSTSLRSCEFNHKRLTTRNVVTDTLDSRTIGSGHTQAPFLEKGSVSVWQLSTETQCFGSVHEADLATGRV
jgi:hypothetical protein